MMKRNSAPDFYGASNKSQQIPIPHIKTKVLVFRGGNILKKKQKNHQYFIR